MVRSLYQYYVRHCPFSVVHEFVAPVFVCSVFRRTDTQRRRIVCSLRQTVLKLFIMCILNIFVSRANRVHVHNVWQYITFNSTCFGITMTLSGIKNQA